VKKEAPEEGGPPRARNFPGLNLILSGSRMPFVIDSSSKVIPRKSKELARLGLAPTTQLQNAIDSGEEYIVVTDDDARRMLADLAELRERRLQLAGGSVFKRTRSRFWQIRYVVDGKSRDESTGVTSESEARRILALKVHEASAGLLPGTASFEQIIANLEEDAEVRGLKAVNRIKRAGRALCQRLEGHRAEQVGRALWVKYVAERQKEVAPDTVHFELAVAHRAYTLARANGVVRSIPDFSKIRNLHVRQGFVDPPAWARVGTGLRPDFGDAAEFAFLCGPREMEILTLKWADIECEARIIHFRETKTRRPRSAPYSLFPELAAIIQRRMAVAERLRRDGIITPWVFCFSQPVVVRGREYHPAGAPVFKTTGEGGLLATLRDEWDAACRDAGVPGLLFHDLRRSAARNMERAGVPRSVAMRLGGWTDKIYSRYAIGAESELAAAGAVISDYLRRSHWHSVGTDEKGSSESKGMKAEGGRSRTFRRAQYPPNRF
jgi:integrase